MPGCCCPSFPLGSQPIAPSAPTAVCFQPRSRSVQAFETGRSAQDNSVSCLGGRGQIPSVSTLPRGSLHRAANRGQQAANEGLVLTRAWFNKGGSGGAAELEISRAGRDAVYPPVPACAAKQEWAEDTNGSPKSHLELELLWWLILK